MPPSPATAMTRNAERVLILGLGALVTPIAQLLAARYGHRHFLAIKE